MTTPRFVQVRRDLPIFAQDQRSRAQFYAPGYLVTVGAEHLQAFEQDLIAGSSDRWPEIGTLHRHAKDAQQRRADLLSRPFAPVCLTLYLNNECNLHCTYCYSMPSSQRADRLAPDSVRSAAELVAENCYAQDRPFVTVFHGGGEPTLHRPTIDAVLTILQEIATARGLSLFRYVATNGVMASSKATWLASQFDLIGLSCDGPEDIQTRQRPLRDGAASTWFVERTARIIRDLGKPLHVRVTVTPYSLGRQAEIAEYLCQQIKPQEIHVEFVYQVGRGSGDPSRPDPEAFVTEFLRGRAVAHQYGVRWLTSGSRPGEIHGPYCQVFREVLNLVPGAVATACFRLTHGEQARAQGLSIGAMSRDGRFALDQARIQDLRARLQQEPIGCESCFNRYHCVWNCPESCPLDAHNPSLSFRCQVQQSLMNACLQQAAAELCRSSTGKNGVLGGEVTDL